MRALGVTAVTWLLVGTAIVSSACAPRIIAAQAVPSSTAAQQRRALFADIQRLATALTPPSIDALDRAAPPSWAEYSVFYATRRNISGDSQAEAYYGGLDDTLKLGIATVTIPDHMRPGLEDARGFCRFLPGTLGCRRGPSNSVLVDSVEPTSATAWLNRIGSMIGILDSVDALVYVHGYNNSFAESTKRAAELAYDIGFPGIVVAYDWASRGSAAGYTVDQETAERSAPDLRRFLQALADSTHVRRITIVAHSMGTRLVSYALRSAGDSISRLRLGPIVFAASDVDSAIFRDQFASVVARAGRPVTLYASSRDKALRASADIMHGAPRVGSGPPSLIVYPGIDYVDASFVDTDMLGHGYFAENKELLDDIYLIVRHGFGAQDRNLRRISEGPFAYFRLR